MFNKMQSVENLKNIPAMCACPERDGSASALQPMNDTKVGYFFMENYLFMENWRDIRGYEGLYQVSDHGRVKTIKGKKHKGLKPLMSFGYRRVALSKNSKKQYCRIARLVGDAFVENPQNKPSINHIDGNKLNDNYLNLEWCTAAENTKHAIDTGLITHDHLRGAGNGRAKLNKQDVIKIRAMAATGAHQKAIGKIFNVGQQCIQMIVARKRWAHI